MADRRGRAGRPWSRTKAAVIELYGQMCWRCGRYIDLTLPPNHPDSYDRDHMDPLALGGSPLDLRRIRPAHARCNRGAPLAQAPDMGRNSEDW